MEVRKSFDNVENYSKVFHKSVEFWKFIQEVELQDLHTKNCDFFKEVMYRCKIQMNALREI